MGELFTCLRSNKSPYCSYEAHGCEGKVGTGPTPTHLPFLAAYREANHVYQVSVRFTAKGCELAANARFVEELKKIMESLISDLTCGVKGPSYRCHSLEAPHRGSPSELFITFQGNGSRRSRMGSGIEHHERTPGTPTRPPPPLPPARPFPSAAAALSLPSPQMEPQRSGSARSAQSKAELQSPEAPLGAQPDAAEALRDSPVPPPAPRHSSPSPLPIPAAQSSPPMGQHRRSPVSPFPKSTPTERREPFPKPRRAVTERRRNPRPSHERRNIGRGGSRGGVPKGAPMSTHLSAPAVNPFAPGWEDLCSRLPQDCEDTTNRRAQEVLRHRPPHPTPPLPPQPNPPPPPPCMGSPSGPRARGINPMTADGAQIIKFRMGICF